MKMRVVGKLGAMLAVAAAAGLSGCNVTQPAPVLSADAFVQNPPLVGPGSGEPIDRPGPLVYDAEHRAPKPPAEAETHISKTVKESVRSPEVDAFAESRSDFPPPAPYTPSATALAQTQPAGGIKPGATTGQYQSLGTVLAVVNGEPIYSHKVVNTLARALAAEARSGSEEHFKLVAEDLVSKQIHEFMENDLEYAAAERSLEKSDEQIAKAITAEWRKDQVRKAGGSEAMARERAADNGDDFEELVQQQYRLNMTRLYYQKKIFPLIQVSAQDMRDYYQAHLREFQKPAAAKFRVIWISSEKTGSRDAALEKARLVYKRAMAGEDFTVLAGKVYNDDPGLMAARGAVGDDKGWMEKGAYASEKVEQAVWQLRPGEITPPIDAPHHGQDGFYVAKLEELQPGKSEPFENQKVQDAIHETLRREQFGKLREAHRRDLLTKAVIRENADMRDAAMEMVMQRYPVWVASSK